MDDGRFRMAVAVYGLLRAADGRILLVRRAGSGYHDGELSLPAGHLDGGEDAVSGLIRELREELLVDVDPGDCTLATTLHRGPEDDGDYETIDLVFAVERWRGTPAIGEPEKCAELVWSDPAELPDDVVGYIRTALGAVARHDPLVLLQW